MQSVINLAPMLDTVASLLAAMLLGLGAFAIQRVLGWLKLSEDEKVRNYLEEALRNGIAFASNRLSARAADLVTVDVRNQVVAEAANYVVERVPDALKRFGIDAEAARDLVLARLPRL